MNISQRVIYLKVNARNHRTLLQEKREKNKNQAIPSWRLLYNWCLTDVRASCSVLKYLTSGLPACSKVLILDLLFGDFANGTLSNEEHVLVVPSGKNGKRTLCVDHLVWWNLRRKEAVYCLLLWTLFADKIVLWEQGCRNDFLFASNYARDEPSTLSPSIRITGSPFQVCQWKILNY